MALQTNIGLFRSTFPEFADTEVYTTTLITFWANVAEQQVNNRRWPVKLGPSGVSMWQTGVYLYVAHEITLEVQNQRTSRVGGAPGTTNGGIATSKTVGGATVQYDAQTTTEKDAGYWNLTTYGKQFFRLTQMFGAGCVQL